MKIALPIDSLLGEIAEATRAASVVIVQAAPGAGKTTRVPPALLKVIERQILVLEPRRIAARLSAERVAEECGERCGETVGFQVRFEEKCSAQTRIKYITEGLLLRYLLSDPNLSQVGCIVIDEFHERHIQTDIALCITRQLIATTRPDLKLVIMSATLNTERLSETFPEAKVFVSGGRVFPVETEYLRSETQKPLEILVADAVTSLCSDARSPGHILVFLPGAAEIRRAFSELTACAQKHNALLLELRSELPWEEQARVFAPSERRKIILATNVAETSVTIDGVTAVVDSGLARISGFASWSGMPTLDIKSISQASCIQRAGRAGRTAPGVAKRLFTQSSFAQRPAFEKPEILRSDLTQMYLELLLILQGIPEQQNSHPAQLPWLDAPPEKALAAAQELLRLLNAINTEGLPTEIGRQMANLPMHPRLSRTAIEGKRLGEPGPVLLGVAILAEDMLLRRTQEAPDIAESDITFQAEIFRAAAKKKPLLPKLATLFDPARYWRIERFLRSCLGSIGANWNDALKPIEDNKMGAAFLAGFPDRVAQVRRASTGNRTGGAPGAIELNLCTGGGGRLSPQSVVQNAEWLIALEADDRAIGANAASSANIRVATALHPDTLLLSNSPLLKEECSCEWNSNNARVRSVERICYGQLVIEERNLPPNSRAAEEILCTELRKAWPKPFEDDQPLHWFDERCRIVQECGFSLHAPNFAGEDFELLLAHICTDKRSFSEISERELSDYLQELLSSEEATLLARLVPDKITVGYNRKVVVHYDTGKPPWISSRLQDFFGTSETPRICNGKVPLVVHLLAPNGQAVQVTTDLAGFWERGYPATRKELCRRYPRHSWPEDPLNAKPPEPRRR